MLNNRTIEIAPSILSADFSRLGQQIEAVERGGAAVLHVDVMDGHFVPNITIGLPVVKSLAGATRLPLDAHLMISEPGRYAAQFVAAGAKMVLVEMFKTGGDPSNIIDENNWRQMSNDGELEKVIHEVVLKNQKAVKDYTSGNKNAIQFLSGQVMAATRGTADPGKVNEILKKILQQPQSSKIN